MFVYNISIAPEIKLRQPYNYKIDEWSIGTIMFLMYVNGIVFDVIC